MSYITTTQLSARPGPRELAQVATPEKYRVPADDLMAATLTGGDRSAWTADEIAAADAALARVEEAVADATALIDGHLGKRYALPLATVPEILTAWARDIVRYKLHGNRISDEKTDPIARDYRDALRLLSLAGSGEFSLGLGDPMIATPETDVRFDSAPSVFSRDELKGFR